MAAGLALLSAISLVEHLAVQLTLWMVETKDDCSVAMLGDN